MSLQTGIISLGSAHKILLNLSKSSCQHLFILYLLPCNGFRRREPANRLCSAVAADARTSPTASRRYILCQYPMLVSCSAQPIPAVVGPKAADRIRGNPRRGLSVVTPGGDGDGAGCQILKTHFCSVYVLSYSTCCTALR